MMNLKNPEKKLYFKLALHGIVILLLACGIMLVVETMNVKEDYYRDSHDSIIHSYDTRIKQKDSINHLLVEQQKILQGQIDSLESVKDTVTNDYGKKINYIYDAPAVDHAMWMDAILAKVGSVKK